MPKGYLTRLGENVRAARKARGLTQEQLANSAGLALSDVGRIERGQRDPGVGVLLRLAAGLEVDIVDLVTGLSE